MRMVLLGPPGVGKGSAAELLIKDFNIPHVSTGNIFRELLKSESPLGFKAKEYMNKGLLVPDSLTNEIVASRLTQDDLKNGFLFDGYPRNVFQAEAFDNSLKEIGWKIDAVINITAPEDIIISRIAGRRVCEKCGAVYHVDNKKSKVDGICDFCGGKTIQRQDDQESTVRNRIEVYYAQTEPVIGYYEKQGILVNVDGSDNIHTTNKLILEALKDL